MLGLLLTEQNQTSRFEKQLAEAEASEEAEAEL